jgi:endonuclease/exonuclease/phosphatase (EEP) superfamily protein YafD
VTPTTRRRRLAALAGWSCALPATALVLARVSRRDERPAIIAAQSVTGFEMALASTALGLAGAAHARALATVAGSLVAVNLKWLRAEIGCQRELPIEAGAAPRLRLFTANLFAMNTRADALADEIMGAAADVVLLQELSFANLPALRRRGVIDAYAHTLVDARADAFGTAILSRFPLVDAEIWRAAQVPMARGTILVGDRAVRIHCVHPRAPFGPRGMARWRDQLASVRAAIRTEPRPLIVAGDFNATWGHARFRDLLGEGLRDAHVERGRGWVTTWPSDLPVVPPVARVDHVLVSPELAVLDAREGQGTGSDHRPLIVDLAVLASPSPGSAPAAASAAT